MLTFEQALDVALEEVKDVYAQSYLEHLNQVYNGAATPQSDEWLTCQILYALNNMRGYKGEKARQVKAAFKTKITELGNQHNDLGLLIHQ